jgi:hypothetical protein
LSLAQNSAGFPQRNPAFYPARENSRQVPHELSRFPLHVNRRAPGDWRPGRWRNAINGTLPGKEGRSGADKRQQIGVDGIGVGGVHPVREARINFQLAVRQQLVLQDGRIFIGTTWSSSPCITSTGKVIDLRSSVWSVSENALMPS